MSDRLRLGMASRLLLAFAALIVPLVPFSAWSYQRALDERRDNALDDQVQLTRTAGALLYGLLREFDTTLLAASEGLIVQQRSLDQEGIGPLLAALAQRYPFLRALFLMGPDGRVIASPSGQSLGTDLSGQPYTRALIGGEDFVLTGAIAGSETGQPLIVMARSVRGGGRLRAMLALAFNPARLSDVFPSPVPPDTLINVLDSSGALLFTTSDAAVPPERSDLLAGLPLVQEALGGRVASTPRSVSPLDGQERLAAAVPIPEYGWVVMLSQTTASVQRSLDAAFRRQILALVAVTLVAFLLAWLLSRALVGPLARLARRARGLGHGELTRPIKPEGPPEVRALAGALNTMAGELQARFAQREAALHEAKDALEVRDRFLSVAAHELRTPLTALKGLVQIARRRVMGGAQPDAVEPVLTRADAQVDRIAGLVDDLLDVGRISAGRLTIEREPVALVPLIERVVELEQAMAPRRRIELDLPDSLPVIDADAARLEQVLFNLLENAHKYSPAHAPIRVRAGVHGDAIEIAVQDQGAGIPAEEQARIFDRFHRASNVDRNVSGLGLGLYISFEIVEAHGGRMTVASQSDAGSTFCVMLPINAPAEASDGARLPVHVES